MASKIMQGFVDSLIIDLGRSILRDNQGKQQLLINKLWEKTKRKTKLIYGEEMHRLFRHGLLEITPWTLEKTNFYLF